MSEQFGEHGTIELKCAFQIPDRVQGADPHRDADRLPGLRPGRPGHRRRALFPLIALRRGMHRHDIATTGTCITDTYMQDDMEAL
jgi:hypothetical protein